MKKIYQNIRLYQVLINGIFLLLVLSDSACKKQDQFLNSKRSMSDVVPSTLQDFQAILDNTDVMNTNYAQLALLGADNNYVTDANLDAATQYERNTYLWAKDIFQGQASYDWQNAYEIVEYCNIVLDGLNKISRGSNSSNYDSIKGSALFFRSMAFYQLTQVFCKPYISASANVDLGIPIRLTSDVNAKSVRATVQQCYDQMTTDLKSAIGLLPSNSLYTTRPTNVAAQGLLAKIYLSMENYADAETNANAALQKFSTLLDFNSNLVSTTLTYRFPTFMSGNPEIIFYATAGSYPTLKASTSGKGYVDSSLYASYGPNDLRKAIFYQDYGNGKIKFQGTYTGITTNFSGIATNEIYLIRAECYARSGNAQAAMTDLNTLLIKRYQTGTFSPLTAVSPDDALRQILQERRKELPYTGQLRWEDLRRLNKDTRFAKTLTRIYNGSTYTLPPNDERYVFPIPDLEIQLYGLPQNPR